MSTHYKRNRISSIGIVMMLIYLSCMADAWAQARWVRQNSGTSTDLESVFFVNTDTGWVAGENGRVLHTTNGGSSWQFQNTPFGTGDLESVFFTDANRGWMVGDDGVILRTDDGGTSWIRQTSGTFNDLLSVFFIDGNTGWAAGSTNTILKTTNGGVGWAPLNTNQNTFYQLTSIFFSDASNGWAVGAGTSILRTTDGGAVWTNQSPPGGPFGTLNSVFFVDGNTGWAVGDNVIIKTSNGGSSWVSQEFSPFTVFNSVFATDASTILAVGKPGRIFRSTDGGASWNLEESGLPLGTELESVFSVDSNNSWSVGEEGEILRFSPATESPTILLANFMNGNNAVFSSEVYLFNPSQSPGAVSVRVFTMPLLSGMAQELTTTPLQLGTLGASAGLQIKLAEDILTQLGTQLPYVSDGGNLALEFTIQAAGVVGAAQVFNPSGISFGTYEMQLIPNTLGTGPTVLVASLMNGNNAEFNSRIYLFNPSQIAGNATVRVFALPSPEGTPIELTTTPLSLGILGTRSAVNIKLAEDILTPAGVQLPYLANGGLLALEFTIQAPGVRGAEQVFSSSSGTGTLPLAVVQ